jgi:hypothetical protein
MNIKPYSKIDYIKPNNVILKYNYINLISAIVEIKVKQINNEFFGFKLRLINYNE